MRFEEARINGLNLFTALCQPCASAWQRHVLMAVWALSALGMVGWWKL
ncbi:hypothetical protein [Comamonas sp.]|nr:hypothetical protein [Comamonas sp.]